MKIRLTILACCALLVAATLITRTPQTVSAQDSDKAKTALVMRKGFAEVSDWVTKSAQMVPEDKYNYRPVDSVRTFGQLIGHITDSYNYFCTVGAGNKVQWADPAEKGKTDKATLIPKLKEALDKCNTVYATDDGAVGPLMENIAHTSLHYGNVITYLRMMGMKPPSS
ncbi:MAG TPA: DinB family protein [Pyrinomonadaceae bacterium]